MSLIVAATALPEVWILEHPVHADARGRFEELWRADDYAAAGLPPFVQDNTSTSLRRVIRGLHFQEPEPQGKLISPLSGAIFDVAVDIRVGSPRFGRITAVTLTAGDGRQLWVPPGFAHGFCSLGDFAQVLYKVTAPWSPAHERAIAWDDPALAIPWPVADPVVSERDRTAPRLANAAPLPRYG